MTNGRVSMEYLMSDKPLNRLPGWVAVSNHPNAPMGVPGGKSECYPNHRAGDIKTAPCFNMVNRKAPEYQ